MDIALTQLHTTYIDVLMPHAPDPLLVSKYLVHSYRLYRQAVVSLSYMYIQNAAEVAKTFKDLQAAGKVKFFGVSDYSPSQLELLESALEKQKISLTTSGGWVYAFSYSLLLCLPDFRRSDMHSTITTQNWSARS